LQLNYIPMKKLFFISMIAFISLTTSAQPGELMIRSGAKGFFLEHTVAAKQGLFPIGRMYNVHPRHIANYNGIDFNKGLSIGQQINIPLTDTNFSQNVFEGVPVYHVAGKENLAAISSKTKASATNLQAWNGSDANNPGGRKLIVGFLITKELQDRVVKITPNKIQEEESVSNVKKQEELKKQVEPVVIKEAEVKKEEPKKTEPEIKKEEPPVVKEEPKKTEPVLVNQPPQVRSDNESGYFSNHFYQQVKTMPATREQTVTSSIFKTTSGWQDAKYYLLINGVEPGTIIKITNPTNSKTVFAKVLYAMDKIRENQGVDIRISDAAAAALSVSETDKFIVKVNY
jgi:LysM domain